MRVAIAVVVFCIFLVACSPDGPICSAPYMPYAKTCCLDKAGNGVCDRDEGLLGQNVSAPSFKYVCPDGSIADHPSRCPPLVTAAVVLPDAFETPKITRPVEVEEPVETIPDEPIPQTPDPIYDSSGSDAPSKFDPYSEQDAAYINRFDVTPVCRGQYLAAELHFDLSQVPERISIEMLENPDDQFRDIGSTMGDGETYFYIGFCADCSHITDVQLPNAEYLVRGALTYGDRTVYTREYVVDPRNEEYAQKKCT